jgi:hypothetical protein
VASDDAPPWIPLNPTIQETSPKRKDRISHEGQMKKMIPPHPFQAGRQQRPFSLTSPLWVYGFSRLCLGCLRFCPSSFSFSFGKLGCRGLFCDVTGNSYFFSISLPFSYGVFRFSSEFSAPNFKVHIVQCLRNLQQKNILSLFK